MKRNTEYLTTGEFARLFGVKKQTMFHYDDMGIFRPEITDENGYRYYSHNQLEVFSIILMLREMGLSVKDIKEQIDKHSPEDLVELLKAKTLDIDRMIDHLRWAREYIGRKIETTEEGISLKDDKGRLRLKEIMMIRLPDEVMIMTRHPGIGQERKVNESIGDHFRYLRSLGLSSCYPDGATIPRDSVKEVDGRIEYRYEDFYTVLTETERRHLMEEGRTGNDTVLDYGGRFLAIYDGEGYKNVGTCLKMLIEYAEKNELKLGDKFYEDVIWDDLSTEDYRNYLVRFSIQVL